MAAGGLPRVFGMTVVAGAFEAVLIQDGRLADGPITVKATFDEVALEIALEYRGDLLSLPARRPVSEDNLVEEQPFVKGLSGFLMDVYPDRIRTDADDGRCRVTLAFDA